MFIMDYCYGAECCFLTNNVSNLPIVSFVKLLVSSSSLKGFKAFFHLITKSVTLHMPLN